MHMSRRWDACNRENPFFLFIDQKIRRKKEKEEEIIKNKKKEEKQKHFANEL